MARICGHHDTATGRPCLRRIASPEEVNCGVLGHYCMPLTTYDVLHWRLAGGSFEDVAPDVLAYVGSADALSMQATSSSLADEVARLSTERRGALEGGDLLLATWLCAAAIAYHHVHPRKAHLRDCGIDPSLAEISATAVLSDEYPEAAFGAVRVVVSCACGKWRKDIDLELNALPFDAEQLRMFASSVDGADETAIEDVFERVLPEISEKSEIARLALATPLEPPPPLTVRCAAGHRFSFLRSSLVADEGDLVIDGPDPSAPCPRCGTALALVDEDDAP